MIPKDLLEDYLIDQEDGFKNLLTWFLNLVMQFEAMEQIDAEPYQRVGLERLIEMVTKNDLSRHELENLD